MELLKRPTRRFVVLAIVMVVAVGVLISSALLQRGAPLSAVEASCVGSWSYMSPDHSSPTRIVYHFGEDRRVREEHYYLLASSQVTVPRITMRGQWRVEPDGRMVVEPSGGLAYVGDATSGYVGDFLDNGRQGWARPVLTRFYQVKSATPQGIEVSASRSGGGGRVEFIMRPFSGAVGDSTLP